MERLGEFKKWHVHDVLCVCSGFEEGYVHDVVYVCNGFVRACVRVCVCECVCRGCLVALYVVCFIVCETSSGPMVVVGSFDLCAHYRSRDHKSNENMKCLGWVITTKGLKKEGATRKKLVKKVREKCEKNASFPALAHPNALWILYRYARKSIRRPHYTKYMLTTVYTVRVHRMETNLSPPLVQPLHVQQNRTHFTKK